MCALKKNQSSLLDPIMEWDLFVAALMPLARRARPSGCLAQNRQALGERRAVYRWSRANAPLEAATSERVRVIDLCGEPQTAMTTTRLLASTVALLGVLSALSGDLAAASEGKVLHVSDSGLKSFVFDAHSRLLRVTFKGFRYSCRHAKYKQ